MWTWIILLAIGLLMFIWRVLQLENQVDALEAKVGKLQRGLRSEVGERAPPPIPQEEPEASEVEPEQVMAMPVGLAETRKEEAEDARIEREQAWPGETEESKEQKEVPEAGTQAGGFELFAFLRAIGVWPPERDERSSELVLMQWWAPRIGGVLALLAVIFFAVYMAQGTPPWVKFVEMLGTSVGVLGLGFYLSRKRPGVGNVLIATGLSMIYVTSVAGYAVGPVRIVENPLIGGLMQVVALVLNFGIGLKRKGRTILVLALIFGYISSLFAAFEGFREAALISALLIYFAGLFSYRRIGGLTLATLSLGGVYLPLVGFMVIEVVKAAPVYPALGSVLVFLVLTVSVLPACCLWLKTTEFVPLAWNRLYQTFNTSAALALGYLFVVRFYPLELTTFYGVMAVAFLLWAGVWQWRDSKGIEFHLFFLKGSSLASLWFINYYHGDLRWMALAIQAVLLVFSVYRTRSVWVELITVGTWLVSFGYYVDSGLFERTGTFLWAMQGVYLILSVAAFAYLMGYTEKRPALRRVFYAIPGLLLAGASIAFSMDIRVSGWDESGSVALMGLILGGFCVVPVFKKWIPIFVGSFLMVFSHLAFWFEPSGVVTLSLVEGVTLLGIVGMLQVKGRGRHVVEICMHSLWVITLFAYLQTYDEQPWYLLAVGVLSLGLFLGGGFTPMKYMSEVTALPVLLLFVAFPNHEYGDFGVFSFVFVLLVLANLGVGIPRCRRFVKICGETGWLGWLMNGLALFWLGWGLSEQYGILPETLVWLLVGGCHGVLWKFRQQGVSFAGLLICGLMPVMRIVDLWLNPIVGGLIAGAPWATHVLAAGLLTVGYLLFVGAYFSRGKEGKGAEAVGQALSWGTAVAAFLTYASSFAYPLLLWERLYTPVLAIFSIVLIVLGIGVRNRAFRYVALLSFLVPLIRLFVFDIKETLYRIVAFAVLSVLLILVGFLYSKYSSRIEE